MSGSKRLIVGLGNPGPEYAGTRHNAGFDVIDALSAHTHIELRQEVLHSKLGWGRFRGREIGLAKPQTYMNLSGKAVAGLIGRFGLTRDDILVLVDDLNLPPGTIRLRQGGSAGGHNGIQDIIDKLGSDDFPRLRIGVGNQFARGRQVDYVLSRYTEEELPIMQEAINTARDAALTFVMEGLVTAMNRYNRK